MGGGAEMVLGTNPTARMETGISIALTDGDGDENSNPRPAPPRLHPNCGTQYLNGHYENHILLHSNYFE